MKKKTERVRGDSNEREKYSNEYDTTIRGSYIVTIVI